jgi:hypothetical protein
MTQLNIIRYLLNRADWDEEDGVRTRRVFLGTQMSLAPSGKYYTAWANTLTADELDKDTYWFTELESELATIGVALENGEGDPCDLFAVEYDQQ